MDSGLILSILILLTGFQQQEPTPKENVLPPYVERGQRQFSFYPGGKLQIVAGVPGNLRVLGWGRPAVMIEFEKNIRGLTPEQAKAHSDQFPLKLRWGQTSGFIGTIGPLPPGTASIEINLTLYVPKDKTDLNIQLLRGALIIGALNGWVEAKLQEGSFEARSVEGYFSILMQKGDVAVEMSGKRWNGHSFTAATQKGSIDLRLPADFSAALQLETRDGNLTIDFPEQLVDGESVPLKAAIRKKVRSLTATVGDGGSAIRLLTHSGDVHLSKTQTP